MKNLQLPKINGNNLNLKFAFWILVSDEDLVT